MQWTKLMVWSLGKIDIFFYFVFVDVFLSIFATKLSFYLRKPSRSQLLNKLPDNIWNLSDFRLNRISYFVLERVIAFILFYFIFLFYFLLFFLLLLLFAFCGELYAIMMEYLYYDFHFLEWTRRSHFLAICWISNFEPARFLYFEEVPTS